MTKLLIGIALALLTACSAQKPVVTPPAKAKIEIPTNIVKACTETVLVFCEKSQICKLAEETECLTSSLAMCLRVTGIRDIKELYTGCFPWMKSTNCETFTTAGQYPACEGQVMIIDH